MLLKKGVDTCFKTKNLFKLVNNFPTLFQIGVQAARQWAVYRGRRLICRAGGEIIQLGLHFAHQVGIIKSGHHTIRPQV